MTQQPGHPRDKRSPSDAKPVTLPAAAEGLSTQRPIRNARVRQIAEQLREKGAAISAKDLREHLAGQPDDVDALKLLAQIIANAGRRREAIQLLERCLALAPDFTAARFNYANLLFQSGRYELALREADSLLAEDGTNPLFRQLKANIFDAIGETEKSLATFEALTAENPARADSWISYGHALRAIGQQEKSITAYRKAIECQPSSGKAWWGLANMKAARFGKTEIEAMEEQLRRGDIPADDRIQIQFAFGKACEDSGEYADAFAHYAKGAAASRLRIDYDPETLTKGVAKNKALFTPAFLRSREGSGCKTSDPIFILGRPRSGSTLIEQILSSHSMIEGTAELPYIMAIAAELAGHESTTYRPAYLDALEKTDPTGLKALGEQYLESARVFRKTGRPFFIDKKPGNFQHIGLIHLILPNAKIIDARRNPAACCFSLFKHHSSKGSIRLAELGQLYRDYVELMAHFDNVLPRRIHRVIYESMVADPEAEVRKLLDYLGLPFEESCLRFYETKRAVLTPSSEQVRRPISGEAVDYWKNFEPWFGPLLRSLGSVQSKYPSVPEELR